MPAHGDGQAIDLRAPAAHFDVREFARTAAGSHRAELDLTAFEAAPLEPETLRALAYLRNVERATMTHLRSMLITATHKDARVTAFLITWAYEKYWVADTLDAVVGDTFPPARADARESTVREAIYANVVGVPMTAMHTALGTVDEWITQAAYRRLSQLQPHPELDRVVAWILGVKARHLDFFEAQTRFRMLSSRRARSLTRRRLRAAHWPIGSSVVSRSETRWMFARLFGTAPDLVRELDALVDSLPGQEGLRLVSRAVRA